MSKEVDLKPIGQTIHFATEKIGDFASELNNREIELAKKQRKLEKIKQKENERSVHLNDYTNQLSDRSNICKKDGLDFMKQYSKTESDLSQQIQSLTVKIDQKIQTLKKMQQERIENEKEISKINISINKSEKELQELEQKDLEAEKILYELTTRPFSEKEISKEVNLTEKTDKTAVDTLLHLNYRIIHDIRQTISEEKKKRQVLKNEFNKLMKDEYPSYKTIDKTQFIQVESRVKSLKRREKRIDKEMNEIANKRPNISTKISGLKLEIQKTFIQKEKYDIKHINFKTDFNPGLNSTLVVQISQIRANFDDFRRKIKKMKQKNNGLTILENKLNSKLRQLTELEIDMEHDSLEIMAQINESKQIELEWTKKDQEDRFTEHTLVSELSEIQKQVALYTSEFDSMLQKHQEFIEGIKKTENENENKNGFISRKKSKIKKMKTLKDKTRKESLKTLAEVRKFNENKDFIAKEIKVLQAKLHQEKFFLNKLTIEQKKFQIEEPLITSDLMNAIKDQIEKSRINIRCKKARIDEKNELLRRIEKVNGLKGHEAMFVVEDEERVYDRTNLRKKKCLISRQKVEKSQILLNKFCEFYQSIQSELRLWNCFNNSTELLHKWIDKMHEVCLNFRYFGV